MKPQKSKTTSRKPQGLALALLAAQPGYERFDPRAAGLYCFRDRGLSAACTRQPESSVLFLVSLAQLLAAALAFNKVRAAAAGALSFHHHFIIIILSSSFHRLRSRACV